MWITIFALTFATAIIFSVASYMLHTKYLARFVPPQRRSPFVARWPHDELGIQSNSPSLNRGN
jgi:hypothetical protein